MNTQTHSQRKRIKFPLYSLEHAVVVCIFVVIIFRINRLPSLYIVAAGDVCVRGAAWCKIASNTFSQMTHIKLEHIFAIGIVWRGPTDERVHHLKCVDILQCLMADYLGK